MLGTIPEVGFSHVDGDRLTRQRRANRPSMINKGYAQISGEEIAGSPRQDGQRDARVG